jgi:glutamate formiminotransferase
MPLVECVPNVSEGRAPCHRRAGARHPRSRRSPAGSVVGPSHNRTVYTFVGEPEPLREAVLRLFESAIAQIDLRSHTGVHPRVGAVDVVPFVPLGHTTMADCVELARSTAELVAQRTRCLFIFMRRQRARAPVGTRGDSARRLRGSVREDARTRWRPDFGQPSPHPTAGVTAIGARPILIAYNVNLASNRLDVAKRIAKPSAPAAAD